MFSILQKPKDAVNAEDLETLQNEIEKCLIDVVTQRWQLERELVALNSTSPDVGNQPSSLSVNTNFGSNTNQTYASAGKLRNSHRLNQIDTPENSSDGFKSSLLGSNGAGIIGSTSGANSAEDSVSSESSLISSLTGSTIITATPDLGSQSQATCSASGLSGKRSHKGSGDRPSKRFRQNSSNSMSSSVSQPKRPPHSKHRSKIVPAKFRNSTDESHTKNKKQVQRNEAPDKLWPFVEQFCATPTEEQIQELDELIKSAESDKDYFKIPALGKKEASVKDSPAKPDAGGKNQKKSKTRPGEEETGLGALTQRLVSSLIEESDGADAGDAPKSTGGLAPNKKKNSKAKTGKCVDINNAKNLEKRIRQELQEYDILDEQDEIPYTSEEDEVLRELIASQHELLAIQRQNKLSMQKLLDKAKSHRELEACREKLREANADVISAYHRLIQARQRKRNPTKKEKDVALKALQVQEAIFKECDELYLSGLGGGGL